MTPAKFAFKIECWMLSFFVSFIRYSRFSSLLYQAFIEILWFLPDLTERER